MRRLILSVTSSVLLIVIFFISVSEIRAQACGTYESGIAECVDACRPDAYWVALLGILMAMEITLEVVVHPPKIV